MPFDTLLPPAPALTQADAFTAFDKSLHGRLAELTGGMSPVLSTMAWFDWLAHLSLSPGKQLDLGFKFGAALSGMLAGTSTQGSRFGDPAWQDWPFNWFRAAHHASEAWWGEATHDVRGVSAQNQRLMTANVQQMLDALSPANFLLTNPVLQRTTRERGGRNLLEGAGNLARDVSGRGKADDFAVGRNLALTPGKVVFRNRLIELIQYTPTTPTVHPEPVLIVPAWIMKYYILDLQPQNSMIRFLVEQGHTVFTISWRNPTAEDQELGFDDYRRQGVMAALDAIGEHVPDTRVHAAGYCLGGTMLSIAAATMARDGDDRLASVTLFAAQTDFTEPGEMKLFLNDTQFAWLDALMARQGGLDGARMGAAFQMLRPDDLIWEPFVRRYLMGETDRPNDLMAWNADQTRMPYRMHAAYLSGLLLRNDLAEGHFQVDGRPIALRDIRVPIFALGTEKDHVAPWRSVYKVALFTHTDVTFVLASGGHNAGVVSEPGHKNRHFQCIDMPAADRYLDPEAYLEQAGRHDGSWWPAWQRWLAARSGAPTTPPAMGDALCDAPGTYVLL